MSISFELVLFSKDPFFIPKAVASGIQCIIIDWENIGKAQRQARADTQINYDTLDDLRLVRACTGARVICRLNSYGPTTLAEVEQAIGAGADEVLLPMVRKVEEVKSVMEMVGDRCGVGILVETMAAVRLAESLGCLPLSRVYVGLNDLAIDRGIPNIFTSLIDGTVESIRHYFKMPFGFGGLTLPDYGHPIPCRLLIAEMARLCSDFSFLRRSFHADIQGRDISTEIPRIFESFMHARQRTYGEVLRDRYELEESVRAWSGLTANPDVK